MEIKKASLSILLLIIAMMGLGFCSEAVAQDKSLP